MKERIGKLNNGFVLRCARSPHQAHLGALASTNPFRFSSEYAEDDTATVYYNYRHYEPVMGRWLQRDPSAEFGWHNIYAFVSNSPEDRRDVVGLFAAIPPALIKCAESIIIKLIEKHIANYFTNAQLCKKAGESFYLPSSGMEPCQPGELPYTGGSGDKPPTYEAASFKESVLECFLKKAKGKTLDSILKGLSDEDLKKLIKALVIAGEQGLKDYLGKSDDEIGKFAFKYNCKDNKLEVQVSMTTTLNTPDGSVDIDVPVSKKFPCTGDRYPQWKNGISDMCDCCDEAKK